MNIKYKIEEDQQIKKLVINNKELNKIVSSYFRIDPIDEKPLNLVKINSGTYGKIYKIKIQNSLKFLIYN